MGFGVRFKKSRPKSGLHDIFHQPPHAALLVENARHILQEEELPGFKFVSAGFLVVKKNCCYRCQDWVHWKQPLFIWNTVKDPEDLLDETRSAIFKSFLVASPRHALGKAPDLSESCFGFGFGLCTKTWTWHGKPPPHPKAVLFEASYSVTSFTIRPAGKRPSSIRCSSTLIQKGSISTSERLRSLHSKFSNATRLNFDPNQKLSKEAAYTSGRTHLSRNEPAARDLLLEYDWKAFGGANDKKNGQLLCYSLHADFRFKTRAVSWRCCRHHGCC